MMTIDRYTKACFTVIAAALVWHVASGLATPIAAQAQAPPQAQGARTQTDVNAALLAEVRALRGELAEATRTSLRAQVLTARVQLQEQRILYFDRRRTDNAARVADAADRSRQTSEQLSAAEVRLRMITAPGPNGPTIPADQLAQFRSEVERTIREAQTESDASREQEQRLRIEQADVEAALATEVGRWNEFNTRLDELERGLPK